MKFLFNDSSLYAVFCVLYCKIEVYPYIFL